MGKNTAAADDEGDGRHLATYGRRVSYLVFHELRCDVLDFGVR